MTDKEAEHILSKLKDGKSICSRFQEEEWSLSYLDGNYSYNFRSFESNGSEIDKSEDWSEERSKMFLLKYSFLTISSRII